MIEAVLNREPLPNGESLVIANDLTQKKLFGIRQGVEFYCAQDDDGKSRNQFLAKLIKENKIDLWLDRIWDLMLCKGEVLFYLRPTGSTYRIYWYAADQFRAYYDADGNLDEVCIIYSYKVRNRVPMGIAGNDTKWIKLNIRADKIDRLDCEAKPDFDDWTVQMGGTTSTVANTLKFIPCVVAQNYVTSPGEKGANEYNWLANQLESHDRTLRSINKNIRFFGNATLIATRSKRELVESGIDDDGMRTTGNGVNTRYSSMFAQSNGWVSSSAGPRRDPLDQDGEEMRVRRVVGNVQPQEQFGYIQPDPVSGDQNLYAREYRENLHTALGGVDPIGINSGATAFEIKSLFGRTAATALKKAKHLYTYGLCQVLEMAIALEEQVFIAAIAQAQFPNAPEKQALITEPMVQQMLAAGKLPKNFVPVGLPPLGDRTVSWRWLGPVFEDSPVELQQKSIVVRNLEEVGVETLHALKFLFDNKTEKEIAQMLTGYPFREMRESHNALMQAVQTYQTLMSTPDVANPAIPLGVNINNLPVIMATIAHIQRRLDYAKQLYPADSNQPGAFTPAPTNQRMGAPGIGPNAIAPGSVQQLPTGIPNTGYYGNAATVPASTPAYGASAPVPSATTGTWYDLPPNGPAAAAGIPNAAAAALLLRNLGQLQSVPGPNPTYPAGTPGTGVYGGQSYQPVEYTNPLPVSGSTVSGSTISRPGAASNVPNGYYPIPGAASYPTNYGIPADLGATTDPTGANILAQLFPTVASILGAVNPVRPRRGRQRNPNQR